jgi:hypothetical protein
MAPNNSLRQRERKIAINERNDEGDVGRWAYGTNGTEDIWASGIHERKYMWACSIHGTQKICGHEAYMGKDIWACSTHGRE